MEFFTPLEKQDRVMFDVKFKVDVKEKKQVLVYENEKNQTIQLALAGTNSEFTHKIVEKQERGEKSLYEAYWDKANDQIVVLRSRLDEKVKNALDGLPFGQQYEPLR